MFCVELSFISHYTMYQLRRAYWSIVGGVYACHTCYSVIGKQIKQLAIQLCLATTEVSCKIFYTRIRYIPRLVSVMALLSF